jgi:hypothetical protein
MIVFLCISFLQRISFEIVFKFDFIVQHEDMLYNQCGAEEGLLCMMIFSLIFHSYLFFSCIYFSSKSAEIDLGISVMSPRPSPIVNLVYEMNCKYVL